MNIDIESAGLLGLILQDSIKDRQLILCTLARSNSVPARINFNPKTDYPTFYGYANSRIPFYLMGIGVLSVVPRLGSTRRLISAHYLSFAEVLINKNKNGDVNKKLEAVSKLINLDNNTMYKDAEVFLVLRDKAIDYIREYALQNKDEISQFLGQELNKFDIKGKSKSSKPVDTEVDSIEGGDICVPEWSDDFVWEGNSLVFGKYGRIDFNSDTTMAIFNEFWKAKGGWVELKELKRITGKDIKTYIRPRIGQIGRGLSSELKKVISLPSTAQDKLTPQPQGGAYRVKYLPQVSTSDSI